MSVTVRFVDNPLSADHGKIVVTTIGDSPTSDHKVGVVGPGGTEVKAFPISVDGTGLLYIQKIDIPTINDGGFLMGEYTVSVFIDNSGTDFSDSQTYNWCPNSDKSLSVETIVDCYAKSLVVNDNTSYPTGTLTREVTIQTPNVFNTDPVADTTTADAQVIVDLTRSDGVAYWNVTYGVIVSSVIVVQDTSVTSWTFEYELGYDAFQAQVLIDCGVDPCDIIGCVDEKLVDLLAEACSSGGIHALPKTDADLLVLLQSNLTMYNFWRECQNSDKVTYYYNQLKDLVGNPSCTDVSGPQAMVETGIVYLRGRSAYEVWLDEGNSGTVDDFLATLYPIGDWVNVDASDFDPDYTSNATNALRYRLLKSHLEFLGSFDSGATEASGFTLLLSTFDPATIETEVGVGIYNRDAGGLRVGEMYKDTDGAWKVRFGTGYDGAQDQYLHGMIPLIGEASVTVNPPTSITFPDLTDWVTIPGSEFINSYTQIDLQWRTDGRFLYFRGTFDAAGAASTGFDVINASYWTDNNISLMADSSAPVFETAANGDQSRNVGYIESDGGTIRMFGSPAATDEGDALLIAGPIILE